MVRSSDVRQLLRAARSMDNRVLKVVVAEASSRRCPWTPKIESLRPLLETDESMSGIGDRTVGMHAVKSSSTQRKGRFLYSLTRHLRPRSVVEMGTSVGVSGAYIAGALHDAGVGRLVTLEGHSQVAETARKTFERLGLDHVVDVRIGRFEETLSTALADAAPVGLAFIDGNHHEEPTMRYFEQMLPHLSEKAVLVFDDIEWSDGMRRAWSRIQADERTRFSLTRRPFGLWGS